MNEITQVTDQLLEDFLFASKTTFTPEQKKEFYIICKMHQLNPFMRQIYAVPRGGRLSIVIGYEVYLQRADQSEQADGHEIAFEGDIKSNDLRCTIKVYRKDRKFPYVKTVWFNEYTQNNQMWNSKPRTMLEKVAIAQGYRMAFPKELGGMPYTSDEIPTEGTAQVMDDKDHRPLSDKMLQAIEIKFKQAGLTSDDAHLFFGVESMDNMERWQYTHYLADLHKASGHKGEVESYKDYTPEENTNMLQHLRKMVEELRAKIKTVTDVLDELPNETFTENYNNLKGGK